MRMKFLHVLEHVREADLRQSLCRAGLPNSWGLMSSTAERPHCNTSFNDAEIVS